VKGAGRSSGIVPCCWKIGLTNHGRQADFERNGLVTSLVPGTQRLSVGSRLNKVIHDPSKRIVYRSRFRATVRWVARLVFVAIAVSWLYLYLDSVYQRRRAEALFADLKSLDFATAGFPEVRDIMIRNGGVAIQRDLVKRSHESLGSPLPPAPGIPLSPNVTFARQEPTCTPQNCTFRLSIMTQLLRIPLLDWKARFFYTTLPYIGVRSWVAYAWFEVRNGKLDSCDTGVGEYRMEHVDYNAYRQLVPLGYEVETWGGAESPNACINQDYHVYISHGVFKFPANALETCVAQSAGAPLKRAFDVHLRCLNGLFRSCRFDEIAPSAWADYSAKNGGVGRGVPHH
jgi:hypothetical protein